MKTLLIAPNYLKVYSYVSEEATMILPPLGMAYIGGYLKHNGIDTKILDLAALRLNDEQEKAAIKRSEADFIAIAATTNTIMEAYALAKKAKEVLPNAKVAVGGPHPTMMPERTLQEFPEIDYCIISFKCSIRTYRRSKWFPIHKSSKDYSPHNFLGSSLNYII